jgi:hypothetical protein
VAALPDFNLSTIRLVLESGTSSIGTILPP